MSTNGERAQWARAAIDRWLVFRYDRRHFLKGMQDTPPDLRWTMPSPTTWIHRSLLRSLTPRFLRQPRKCWMEAMETFDVQPWFAIAVALGLFLIVSAYWSLR